MRHHVIAMSLAAALLAACGDEPRGPLEVQGKTMIMEPRLGWAEVPVTIEFSGREKGKIINGMTGESQDIIYTLKDTELRMSVLNKEGKPGEEAEFSLDGKRYKGDELILKEMTEKDAQEMAERAQKLKEEHAKEQERKALEEKKAAELAAKLSPKGAPKDKASYNALADLADESNHWSAWLYIAHKHQAQKREDEELLRLFSEKWNSTKDSFDRQAMRADELKRIQERLDQVRTVEYIHLPWSEADSTLGLSIQTSDDGSAYDFEKKSFRLSGTLCSYDSNLSYRSGAKFSVTQEKAFCLLPVADEAVARQIESARTSRQGVHTRPDGYFKVVPMGDGSITLVPVGLEIPLYAGNRYQQRPGELVANISHWPH